MPAVDRCEPQIIHALEKDGWQIVRKHYPIHLGRRNGFVFADLRLQRNDTYAMIVELKCLMGAPFALDEFYGAVGQYLVYKNGLELNKITEPLYLALPEPAYQHCMENDVIRATLINARINIIVVDLEVEEIVQWVH